MTDEKDWGIAMEGCGDHIKNALLLAIVSIDRATVSNFIYIEIGAGEGRTINKVCEYLDSLDISYKAVAIDIKNGWSLNEVEFNKNTLKHWSKVILDLSGSPKALSFFDDGSISAILIDGDHSKQAVIEDFKEADRILVKGGVVMFHDTDEESQGLDAFERQPKGIEVRKAIEELGLLCSENYNLISDYPGDKQSGGRGIMIFRKTV